MCDAHLLTTVSSNIELALNILAVTEEIYRFNLIYKVSLSIYIVRERERELLWKLKQKVVAKPKHKNDSIKNRL